MILQTRPEVNCKSAIPKATFLVFNCPRAMGSNGTSGGFQGAKGGVNWVPGDQRTRQGCPKGSRGRSKVSHKINGHI